MEPNGTQVRFAAAGEVDAAIAVWRASNDARSGGLPTPPEVEAMVRGWIAVPDAMLLVAERDGRIVGMTLAVDGREDSGAGPAIPGLCHISQVFVAPEAWGQGIGTRLVDAILAEAQRRDYTRVQLFTHETNVRAQRLYISRRFAFTGDTQVNAAGETVRRYERPL